MYGRSIALPVVASSDKQRLLCSQKMSAGKLSCFPSYRQRDLKVKIPAYTFIPLQSCATLLWILSISFLDFFAFCHCSHCGRLPLTLQKGCIKQRKQLLLPLISTSFNLPPTAFPLLFAMHVGKHFLSSFSTTIPTNQKDINIHIYNFSRNQEDEPSRFYLSVNIMYSARVTKKAFPLHALYSCAYKLQAKNCCCISITIIRKYTRRSCSS